MLVNANSGTMSGSMVVNDVGSYHIPGMAGTERDQERCISESDRERETEDE
jgi:hypothetical protein